MSGQIGLIPASMQTPSPPSATIECVLSLQHMNRIISALKDTHGNVWSGIDQCVLIWAKNAQVLAQTRAIWSIYQKGSPESTPVLFAVCKSIPRNALVEVQALVHTGRTSALDEDTGEAEEVGLSKEIDKGVFQNTCQFRWQRVCTGDLHMSIVTIQGTERIDHASLGKLREILTPAISVRLFGLESYWGSRLHMSMMEGFKGLPVTPIPCRALGTKEEDCHCAMIVFSVVP